MAVNGAAEEGKNGTIEPGNLADPVILDADPTAVPTSEILHVTVVETFKEGSSVCRAQATYGERG